MTTEYRDWMAEFSLLDVKRIARGLAAPRNSGEHKQAVMALTRLFGPVGASLLISALVLAGLLCLVTAKTREESDRSFVVNMLKPEALKPTQSREVEKAIAIETSILSPVFGKEMELVAPDVPVLETATPVNERLLTAARPDAVQIKAPMLPGLFESRVTPAIREKTMADFGAPAETEDTVLRALRWMKKMQDPDGSWKKASDVDHVAMTGLALLAFLAHGETPQNSREFGPCVERALRYLLDLQARAPDGRFSQNAYTHAIATYALAEAAAMTRITEVRQAMEKALAFLIRGQLADGGFYYEYAKTGKFDTSVAGWNIQAMKAAKAAQSANPGLDAALDKAVRFLKTQAFAQNGSGFVYQGETGRPSAAGGRWTMTGVGTLCLQLLGHSKDGEVKQGLQCLKPQTCEWPSGQDAKPSLYGWYYLTQATFQKGGDDWDAWNRKFGSTFVRRQVREADGCGYWPTGDHGGAVYATTLATLTLEVYYRYLPSYQAVREKAPSSNLAQDDFQVEVL